MSPHESSNGAADLVAAGVAVALVSAVIGAGAALAAGADRFVLGATPTVVTAAAPPVGSATGSIEQVAAKVVPSVVELEAHQGNVGGEGSGIILSTDGLILTNAHVVMAAAEAGSGAATTTVTFSDGRTVPFAVVATDPATDIAVVRAQGVSGLTPIRIGRSANLRVGQRVAAVGSPLGLDGTVTAGIVSALHRPVPTGVGPANEATAFDAIQTDAAINPGNSGGALVNMNGELIGVNSASATLDNSPAAESGSIGLGFAIPVDQAKRIADELVATGTASHASLGVQVGDDVSSEGARIVDVTSGGPAALANLPVGVVVTDVDGQVVDGADALVAAVQSKAPGEKVTVTYRDASGADRTAQITLGTDQTPPETYDIQTSSWPK
jgi:putative serine protease PepD